MKKIKYLLFLSLIFMSIQGKVNAAASLSTSSSQVYSGDTFNTTVNLSGVASWEVHVNSTGPVSGCVINAADATENALNGSKSYSVKCSTTGVGTIKITLSGNTTTETDSKKYISGTKTVNVISKSSTKPSKKPQINNPAVPKKQDKSSNCNLKSLEIENYKLSPEFNKDVFSYNLTVPNDTKTIKILAYKEDDKANLSGDDGEKEVKEGENQFTVIVTAENGNKKEYKINIYVDSKPIIVKLNDNEYNLIKNKDEMPELQVQHEDITLTIENQEVPAYRIDKINYVLVGLKNDQGKINLYKFDSFKNDEKPFEYKLFNLLEFSNNSIILTSNKSKIPSNYKQYKEIINEQELLVYKLNKNSKYSLISGISVETGKENIYKYEASENTLQIFEREEQKLLEEEVGQYKKLILILGIVIIFLILLVTIGFTRKRKIIEVQNNKL